MSKRSFHQRLSEISLLSDAAVKHIFDHVRNIALSALVAGSGVYWWQHPTSDPKWFIAGSVAMLCMAGLLLLVINFMHGLRRLGDLGVHPKLLWLLAVLIYVPSIGLFLQQVSRR